MKICSKCEVNYITDEQEFCVVCQPECQSTKKSHNHKKFNNNKTEKEKIQDKLSSIGTTWVICYLYYKYIDNSFLNYKLVDTYLSRKSTCDNNEDYIIRWLIQAINKNEKLLGTNSLGVSGDEVKKMAIKIAEYFIDKLKDK